MACGPIDYRRQQRERWIEIVHEQLPGHSRHGQKVWAQNIVDAIMESEHSVVAEQGAELEDYRRKYNELAAEMLHAARISSTLQHARKVVARMPELVRESAQQAAEIERLKKQLRLVEEADSFEAAEIERLKAENAELKNEVRWPKWLVRQ